MTEPVSCLVTGSGSHKVLHVLVNSRTSSAYFSTTRDVTSKSSSDLDRGRRPKLKSEEFCEVTSLVVEIICDFCEIAGRSSCTFLEPDPEPASIRVSEGEGKRSPSSKSALHK